MRYYSFEKMVELKAAVKKHVPVAISVGAVYSEQVRFEASARNTNVGFHIGGHTCRRLITTATRMSAISK